MPDKEISSACIDIRENDLMELSPEVLTTLLRDHTTGRNIFWATHDYEALGSGYDYHSEILPELITGENGMVIRPRVLKYVEDSEKHTWQPCTEKITFPEGKTWKDYVRATRMEMTCGEAPYLVSRYDTTTGEEIPLEQRVGLLDRKLRVVSENTETSGDWLDWAQTAYMNTYGFEWQGDNLLLAREALLWTFIEYYQTKFHKQPMLKSINYIAYIISWNLWQMDGLKGVVPDSCHEEIEMTDLFSGEGKKKPCQGCMDGGYYHHNGIYCLLRDWGVKDPVTKENNRKIRFIDLIKK